MTTQKYTSPKLEKYIQIHNLDVSVISNKDIKGFTRIEAEFYLPKFLSYSNIIDKKTCYQLGDITKVISGPAYSSESIFSKKTINSLPIIKIGDVTNKRDITSLDYVGIDEIRKYSNKFYRDRDILISMTGDPWNVGGVHTFYNSKKESLVFNQRVSVIRDIKPNITQEYIYCFLDTEYARFHIERWAMGIRQRNISINDIKTLKVPLPSKPFQEKISEVVQEAHKQRELSKKLYAEAENILLEELDLKDWRPSEVNISEKMSEEVDLFGRFDAEFFQPKYDELFSNLSKFQTDELGNIVDYLKGVEPGSDEYSDEGIPFARVSDFSINGFNNIGKKVSHELFDKYGDDYSPKKDEILFTKDGTIGITGVVSEDMEIILSGAFLRFQKIIKIESEYLALVLNSIVSKLQIERFSGGAIIAHLKPSDAMKIIIPILSDTIQKQIAEKIKTSHKARELSEKLLQNAKKAVEVYIEKDEEEGLRCLLEL